MIMIVFDHLSGDNDGGIKSTIVVILPIAMMAVAMILMFMIMIMTPSQKKLHGTLAW